MKSIRLICCLVLGVQSIGAAAQPKTAPRPPSGTLQPAIPRATFITNMNAEFVAMDANKDGKVTKEEVEARSRSTAAAAEQSRNRALFQALDTDRNGQLSPAEFAKTSSKSQAANGLPVIQHFDSNRDNVITIIEYRTGTLANFDKMDTDKDGVVTPTEMRAAGLKK